VGVSGTFSSPGTFTRIPCHPAGLDAGFNFEGGIMRNIDYAGLETRRGRLLQLGVLIIGISFCLPGSVVRADTINVGELSYDTFIPAGNRTIDFYRSLLHIRSHGNSFGARLKKRLCPGKSPSPGGSRGDGLRGQLFLLVG
jgi:hypothetical protein